MRALSMLFGPGTAPLSIAGRLITRIRTARERRSVVKSLATFDDHMLRDIGLTRFDLDSALVEPILADPTLILADRARDLRRHQRAIAQETLAWADPLPPAGERARAA